MLIGVAYISNKKIQLTTSSYSLVASGLWAIILSMFRLICLFPSCVMDRRPFWKGKGSKKVWVLVSLVLMWIIWEVHNWRTFDGVEEPFSLFQIDCKIFSLLIDHASSKFSRLSESVSGF